jgi:hypothetical protein
MFSKQEEPMMLDGERFDTLFYQGILTSQTQVLKYVGSQTLRATTGQKMWSVGCNNRKPLEVIYNAHLGKELDDINLNPFTSYLSYLNPIKIIGCLITWGQNAYYGVEFTAPIPPNGESVAFHTHRISQINAGQHKDMTNHKEKYDLWLKKSVKANHLVLWGVSRGTAATFCAFAQHRYPEVSLVVLEGAVDSMQNILSKYVSYAFGTSSVAQQITGAITNGLSIFKRNGYMSYDPQGPSPLSQVNNFPEGVPVVFITSKIIKGNA